MSCSLLWLVLGLTCCGLFALCTADLEYTKYCERMCMYGRGGNLCRCNAVHFAGKRAQQLSGDELRGHLVEDDVPSRWSDQPAPHHQSSEYAKLLPYLMSVLKKKHVQQAQPRHLSHQQDIFAKIRDYADRPSYRSQSLDSLLRSRDFPQEASPMDTDARHED